MTGRTIDDPPPTWRSGLRGFLLAEWPYLSMLVLALLGVAYTSVSHTRTYWIALAPFIGLICVFTRWGEAATREARWRLVLTQILHWAAVLLAMMLMPLANVTELTGGNLGALSALTLVALGTFLAGLHILSWRIGLVGIILGVSVPAIALLQQSALLIMLILVVLAAVIAPFLWHARKSASPAPVAQPVEPAPTPERFAPGPDPVIDPVEATFGIAPSDPEPGIPARQSPPFS